jgi:Ran-binding protein 3
VVEFSCRAKLYNFVTGPDGKKEWKERGLGVLRLNTADPPLSGLTRKARLLMRADGSHRVILNTPLLKEATFGGPKGGKPAGGYIYFMGAMEGDEGEGKLEMLQLKVCHSTSGACCEFLRISANFYAQVRPPFALELHEKVTEIQEAM